MKAYSLHILFFLLGIPFMVMSQEVAGLDFYRNLGIQDAKHEIALGNLNLEDEKDFWVDQKNFEELLRKNNTKNYQSYLNGKYQVYREHQILCGGQGDQSDEFSRQMAFYLINGESTGTDGLVLELRPKRK